MPETSDLGHGIHSIDTGFVRPFFDASLRRELKRARRYGLAFSLVMLDVDDFKMVNDLHGHVVGDEALARLSDVIRASVREIDVACRYGGEEFALILPETSRTGAYIVSERIRLDAKETFDRRPLGAAPASARFARRDTRGGGRRTGPLRNRRTGRSRGLGRWRRSSAARAATGRSRR